MNPYVAYMDLVLFFVVMTILFTTTTIVHEFGHYLACRATGVHVVAFNFGYGPTLFRKKRKSGLLLRFRAVQVGGSAEFFDERLHEDIDPSTQLSFDAADPVKRMIVGVAGSTANFVYAIVLFLVVALVTQSDLGLLERLTYPFVTFWNVLEGYFVSGVLMMAAQVSFLEFLGGLQLELLGLEQNSLFFAEDRAGLTVVNYIALYGAFSIIHGLINLFPAAEVSDGPDIISAFLAFVSRRHSISKKSNIWVNVIGSIIGFAPLVLGLTYLIYSLF